MDEKIIIKYLEHECRLSEICKVAQKATDDADFRSLLFDMERIWILKDELKYSDPEIIDEQFNALWERIQTGAGKTPTGAIRRMAAKLRKPGKLRKPANPLSPILKYAAAAAIIILLGIDIMLRINNVREEPVTFNTAEVPEGQRVKLLLSDSSTVWLNAHSKFTYPSRFSGNERNVSLDGEGYFIVEKNARKPFVVQTSQHKVTATGTIFDIYAYSNSNAFETILIDGSVTVEPNDQSAKPYKVKPGQKYYYDETVGKMKATAVETQKYTTWITGLYFFDDITFEEMAKRLEHYYKTTIVITDSTVMNYRGTGKFYQHETITDIMRVVQSDIPFSYVYDKEKNVLTINKMKR